MKTLNALRAELAEKTKQFKDMEKTSGGYVHEGLRGIYKQITVIREKISEAEDELL